MKSKARAQLRSEATDVATYMRELGRAARESARELARAGSDAKNRALRAMAAGIRARPDELLEANRAHVKQARKAGRRGALVYRLPLNSKGTEQLAQRPRHIA